MSKRNIKGHQCVLGMDTDEFAKLPSFASWTKRLNRNFKMSRLLSYDNPRSQLYYRTNTAMAAARKKHAHSRYNHIIHPFSSFRMTWELFMLISYVAYLFILPLSNTHPVFYIMMLTCVFQLSCVADLIVTFFTGYTIDHVKQVVIKPRKIAIITGLPLDNNSWIVKRNIVKMPSYIDRYFEATFKAAGHLLCVSNPMYRPETLEDGIVAFSVSIFGYLLSCLGLVIFVQMMFRIHISKIKYECVMNQLSQYMRHKQLPMPMQHRLTDYYEFRFRRLYFKESTIHSILSDRLKQDINAHICTILLNKVEIFQNVPESVLNSIVSNLRPEVFLPNDIILKAAMTGDCMYFIYTGTVAYYTPTGKEIYHLQDGGFFGIVALVAKDQKGIANIVAIETTEVFRLDRVYFNTYIRTLPELYKKFELVAERRRENTLVMEEIHRKQILEKTMKKHYDQESLL